MIELDLPLTSQGVCNALVVVLGRREIGKTTLLADLGPQMVPGVPPEELSTRLAIVSPLPVLKERMRQKGLDVPWYKVSVSDKDGMQKLFADFQAHGKHLVILADEGDELSGARGFNADSVYNFVNYARNYGQGMVLSTRHVRNTSRDVLANANLLLIGNTTDDGSLDYYRDVLSRPVNPQSGEEADLIPIIKKLPPYVFLAYQPTSTPQFKGYLYDDHGDIRDWDPSELREWPPKEDGQLAPQGDPQPVASASGETTAPGMGAESASSGDGATAPSTPTRPPRKLPRPAKGAEPTAKRGLKGGS